MVREKTDPLSTEQAKERLREASQRFGVTAWVQRQPLGSLAFGVLAGMLLAHTGRPVRHAGWMARTLRRML